MPDDLGLHAALGNYAEKWSKRSGMPGDFHDTGLADGRVSRHVETAIYRLAQEALTTLSNTRGPLASDLL